ncbi:MAG TPA: hypothetical protein VKZ67_09540 [Natronosporangium sp.]|nr:hypothetical protein [Natronosporangium sp.]
MTGEDSMSLHVAIARLEGKVDATLMGHSTRLEMVEKQISGLEARMLTQEQRPVVRPGHIYAGVSLACLMLSAVVGVLALVFRG